MSDGDRNRRNQNLTVGINYALAVLIACLIVGFFAYLEGQQSEARQDRSYEYEQSAKRNATIACANGEPAAIADCVYNEIQSAREKSESEQDLQAQQWMARWAGILTIITALTTVISWVALRYLRDTFRETATGAKAAADATKAMKRQNELTERVQRPWVSIKTKLVGPHRIENGALYIGYEIAAKNSGSTPALYVVSGIATEKSTEDRKISFVSFANDISIMQRTVSRAIAPNDEEIFRFQSFRVKVTPTQLNILENGTGSIPLIIGCTYYDGTTNNTHYTIKTMNFIVSTGHEPTIIEGKTIMGTIHQHPANESR